MRVRTHCLSFRYYKTLVLSARAGHFSYKNLRIEMLKQLRPRSGTSVNPNKRNRLDQTVCFSPFDAANCGVYMYDENHIMK